MELKCGDVKVGDVFVTVSDNGYRWLRVVTGEGFSTTDCFYIKCSVAMFGSDGQLVSMNVREYFTLGNTPEGWTTHRLTPTDKITAMLPTPVETEPHGPFGLPQASGVDDDIAF